METNNQIANLAKYEHPELEVRGLFRRCFFKPTQSPVKKDELFFAADDYTTLKSALDNKHFDALKKLRDQSDGNVKLVIANSKDGKFAAVQLQRYQPFEFRPETEIMMMSADEFANFMAALKAKKS